MSDDEAEAKTPPPENPADEPRESRSITPDEEPSALLRGVRIFERLRRAR